MMGLPIMGMVELVMECVAHLLMGMLIIGMVVIGMVEMQGVLLRVGIP